MLVIGEDSDAKRESRGNASRTDTMMIVSLSARQKRIDMISIPRDTVDVPLPDGLIWSGKINGLAWERGYDGLVGAVETLLAIDVDAYIKVDMDNFEQLVDAVGGVKVSNPYYLADAHLHLALPAGTFRLDGATALAYVRSRYQDGDYARAARQQQVLLALVRKFINPQTDWDLDAILAMLDSLKTDIDLTELPTLIEMARRARTAEVNQIVLAPPRFAIFAGIEPSSARGWVMIPNVAEMQAYAAGALAE